MLTKLWNVLVAPLRLVQRIYQAEPVRIAGLVITGLTALAIRFGWNGEDAKAYLLVMVPQVLAELARMKVTPVAKLDAAVLETLIDRVALAVAERVPAKKN